MLHDPNTRRLDRIAKALGELNKQVVFVGGCVAQLYAEDPAATDIRPTMDVDCVVNLSSYPDYNHFCELLRARRFTNDTRPGAPYCRWTFEDEIIDVMPQESFAMGESNRWYKPGIAHKVVYEVSEGLFINILPAVYYIATKLEANASRGGNDLRISHDFEDVIYVLNYSSGLEKALNEIRDRALREYLQTSFSRFLSRPNIREEIECALPYGETGRVPLIIGLMERMVTGLETR